MRLFTVFLLLGLLVPGASAHQASNSFITLTPSVDGYSGRIDVAWRDLAYALPLDSDGDHHLTWGEVKGQRSAIEEYVYSHLALVNRQGESVCAVAPQQLQVVEHSDGSYGVLTFALNCRSAPWGLDYRLFFDLDPSHRGLLQVTGATTQSAVLSPQAPTLQLARLSRGSLAADYLWAGVKHLLGGVDHLLFVLALVLPLAFGVGQRTTWSSVVALITAFTLAHAVSLTAAVVLGFSLPARWVEPVIAATIVIAALHNLKLLWRSGAQRGGPKATLILAFGLGLIHGLGVAGVLIDLSLPPATLALALASFNLGIELGQLLLAGLIIFTAWALVALFQQRRWLCGATSATLAAVALGWCLTGLFRV